MFFQEMSYDINNLILEYIAFKPISKEELQKAVDHWCEKY